MESDIVTQTLESAKAHPAWRMRLSNAIVGALFFLGGLAGIMWSPLFGLSLMSIGAWFSFVAWSLNEGVRDAALAGRVFDAIDRGDKRSAETLLDVLSQHPSRSARRIILLHRASLARNTGDFEAVEVHTTAAIAVPLGFMMRDLARAQRAMAYAARALGRSLRKDKVGALADVERARQGANASSLAVADLALAVVAAEENRRDDVREFLNGSDLIDELSGRERKLLHSLLRFADEGRRSVYRHPAKPDDSDGWMPKAAKEAEIEPFAHATFVPRPTTAIAGNRAIILWGVLIGLFSLVWLQLNKGSHRPVDAPTSRGVTFVAVVFASVMLTNIVSNIRRAARLRVARAAAILSVRRGDGSGLAVLSEQAKSGSPEAELELALFAERESRFLDAIAHCDAGIARATGPRRLTTFDYTAPALFAERAFCLAALGRVREASTAMEAMPNAANFGCATRSRLRVHLAIALTRGDYRAALDLGRKCGDTLNLTARDAFLIDWLEATRGRGADDAEWGRLQRELAAKPHLAKWIEELAPGSQLSDARIATSSREADTLDDDDEDSASPKRTREKGVDA